MSQEKPLPPEIPKDPPVPAKAYYSTRDDIFYGPDCVGLGVAFRDEWYHRRDEFPQSLPALRSRMEPVPQQIYYSARHDNFFDADSVGMGLSFYSRWLDRRDEFPQNLESLASAPLPRDVYYSVEADNFYGPLRKGCGNDFYSLWRKRSHEFPQSYEELAASRESADSPVPLPADVYYSREVDNFCSVLSKGCGAAFRALWYPCRSQFPQSLDELIQVRDSQPIPQILKGVGRYTGDGWKDTTVLGEIVYVWNSPLSPPHAPGQYPRVQHPGWSASVEQYAFSPVSVEEVRQLFASAKL